DHQTVVAGERQLASAVQGMAVDGGDQRLWKVLDFRERRLAATGHLGDPLQRRGIFATEPAVATHGLDIGAGHEVAIDGAGQHHDASRHIVLDPVERVNQLFLELRHERVDRGPVHPDGGDEVAGRDLEQAGHQKVNRSRPPVTGRATPVMYPAAGEHRNVIAFAISSGSPGRRSATRLIMRSFMSGRPILKASVPMMPGTMALTVMLYRAPSS